MSPDKFYYVKCDPKPSQRLFRKHFMITNLELLSLEITYDYDLN